MGLFDIFGGGKKKAEEEERLVEQQKEEEHQRLVDEAKKTHEGMPWPGIMKINLLKKKEDNTSRQGGSTAGSGGEQTPPVIQDPISAERKEEIGQLVFEPDLHAEDISSLTLQELMFLMDAQILFQRKAPLRNYEQNHRVLYNDLLRRIHEAEHLYVLYNRLTRYPLLDGPFALVYLEKEHAQTAAKLYQQQYRQVVVADQPGEAAPDLPDGRKNVALFDYLYYLGIENVLIDNGWYKAAIKRSEISAPPTSFVISDDTRNTPPASPELFFAMLDFTNEATWPVKYDKRQDNLRRKMNRINALIPKSRFVVPIQQAAGTEASSIQASGGKSPIRMPLINVKARNKATGAEEDKKFLPVFTDMFEYAKGFKQEGFRPAVFEFRNLLGVLGGAEGFVINPRGASIVVPKAEAFKMLQASSGGQTSSVTAGHNTSSGTNTSFTSGAQANNDVNVFARAASQNGSKGQHASAKVLSFPGTAPEKPEE